jgi:hypothetical protein
MKIKNLAIILAAGTLLMVLTGCDEDEYRLKFSHYVHVTDNGMDCDECHGEAGEASFNALSHDTCIDCHDEPEAEEINTETCGYCHQEKQVPLLMLESMEEAPAEVSRQIFVHTDALSDRCLDCHGDLMDESYSSVPELSRGEVLQIREEAHNSGEDCLTCHIDMDRYREPADHDLLWMKRHGLFGIQLDASCSVCHSEDSCKECHSVMQPMSHNNMFRLRTHGVEAAWDRQACILCHEEDSCTSCHSQASPRSHRGRWSASGKYPTHCFGCHTSATAGEGCVVCHEEGNNVMLHQPYWTPIHDRFEDQLNCYECHNPYTK